MRHARFACLVAVLFSLSSGGAYALDTKSGGGGGNKKPDPEKLKYSVVMIVDGEGERSFVAIETSKVRDRQKELAEEYYKAVKAYRQEYAAFKRDRANRGQRFDAPKPRPSQLQHLSSRIKGKTAANKLVAEYLEQYLKQMEKKEEAARKKAEAKASGGRSKLGGASKRAAAPPPKGNLVKNGGFETAAPGTKVPEHWRDGQWGARSASCYIRHERGEVHGGERSVMVRARGAGALGGVYTTLTVPAGNYEVRFWAVADVDERATVKALFGAQEVVSGTVGDKWQQFRAYVVVDRQKRNVSLKLATSTSGVKVCFDDVEFEAVQRPAEKALD